MAIKPIPTLIQGLHGPTFKYRISDGREFLDLDEAVEEDNKLNTTQGKPVVYEQIWTIQQAINMAIAEDRVVRFICRKTNKEIRSEIDDLKGCQLLKPDKDSFDVAIVPPSIKAFDFNEVK